MTRIAVVLIGLTLVGCSTADSGPTELSLGEALTAGAADGSESPFIDFEGKVALIRVDRCNDGCQKHDILGRAVFIRPEDETHKNFDNVVWYTAVTEPSYDPDAPSLDMVPAAISGPIYYGVLPEGATFSWPDQVEPLEEGPVYAVNVTRWVSCPADEDCDDMESTTGLFFKVEHGDLIEVSPDVING